MVISPGTSLIASGPELCAGEDLATAIGRALGITVKYENISE